MTETDLGTGPEDPTPLLTAATAALPAGEDRPGQRAMAAAVAAAVGSERHLIVQAGTGTGKTLAYLAPVIASGQRAVVVTATMALQDQLAHKDLPAIAAAHSRSGGDDLQFAVLKGRSNYICRQRIAELAESAAGTLPLDTGADSGADLSGPDATAEITRLTQWAEHSATGEMSELDWTPRPEVWRAVSVTSDQCPGAERCPQGADCFAELARHRAAVADIVVVNTHLYGMHVRSEGALLPDHPIVIVDEAHLLEDVISDTIGTELGPGRLQTVASAVSAVLAEPTLVMRIRDAAEEVRTALGDLVGQRLRVPAHTPLPAPVAEALGSARTVIDQVNGALTALRPSEDGNSAASSVVSAVTQRLLRAQMLTGRTADDLDMALRPPADSVTFVTGSPDHPRLAIAPLDVGPALSAQVWSQRTAVLTSATIPAGLSTRLGMPAGSTDELTVESPFDYPTNSLLYCALHLPDPREPAFRAGVHEELIELIAAAGGRTLALFTSWAAMDEAATAVRPHLAARLLTQRDLPKPALLRAFGTDESSCLFATAGFFQGVDIPGRSLSLVTIDRLPFPRPDDPLLSARREALGSAAFGAIDLPRASMMLAQAAGRLIRTSTDRGVVAVFDRRLGTANYRWNIISALPPMRRTRERSEAAAFLREITN